MVVNQHGFEVLKDSKECIEATARVSRNMKFTFVGRCTVEKKFTPKYGWQIVVSVWLGDGVFPQMELTSYQIDRGRIEICLPLKIAKSMKLIR